ncbi:unnamed protein product, partial [Mycena citricolor]
TRSVTDCACVQRTTMSRHSCGDSWANAMCVSCHHGIAMVVTTGTWNSVTRRKSVDVAKALMLGYLPAPSTWRMSSVSSTRRLPVGIWARDGSDLVVIASDCHRSVTANRTSMSAEKLFPLESCPESSEMGNGSGAERSRKTFVASTMTSPGRFALGIGSIRHHSRGVFNVASLQCLHTCPKTSTSVTGPSTSTASARIFPRTSTGIVRTGAVMSCSAAMTRCSRARRCSRSAIWASSRAMMARDSRMSWCARSCAPGVSRWASRSAVESVAAMGARSTGGRSSMRACRD